MSKAGASLATCYGPVSADVIAKAENIRLLILDVDGVLSDGLIYICLLYTSFIHHDMCAFQTTIDGSFNVTFFQFDGRA